ncbi:MAG: amidase, partial [bacterium]|nr:amidase [bacterium]
AAVAAGHCSIALGSQTSGSVLRPASFCGIVGFKPTFGRLSAAGVTPLAPSLDHVGILARGVGEASAAARAIDPSIAIDEVGSTLRVRVDDLSWDDAIEPASWAALERAGRAFQGIGAALQAVKLPAAVPRAVELLETLVAYESFQCHGRRWRALGEALPPRLAELMAAGESTPRGRYDRALAEREEHRAAIDALFRETDLLLTPCVPGEAPERATTGDARYLRPWTFYGLPALTLPVVRGAARLPVGVQLVAPLGRDGFLLWAARRLEAALSAAP